MNRVDFEKNQGRTLSTENISKSDYLTICFAGHIVLLWWPWDSKGQGRGGYK